MHHKSLIADTYGMTFLGAMIAGILYGITVVQTYIYLNRYPQDRVAIKAFVAAIFILDTFHQASLIMACWHYFIDSFDIPTNFLLVDWSVQIYFEISILIGFLVQMFYTYRIWSLTRNSVVCASIIVLSLLHLSFGTYFGVKIFQIQLWVEVPHYSWVTDVSLSCSSAADIVIAAAMTIILHNRSTDYDRTRNMLHKLIAYIVGTGSLTVVMSMTIVIVFATGHTFVAAAMFFTLAKVYTNAALICLNARESLKRGLQPSQESDNSRENAVRLSDVRHYGNYVGMKNPHVVHIHKSATTDLLETTPNAASEEHQWGSTDKNINRV